MDNTTVKMKDGRNISILPVYGARDGFFSDSYIGDVYLSSPTPHAVSEKGKKMWCVHVRFDREPRSYHRTENAARRAMRRKIRSYFGR